MEAVKIDKQGTVVFFRFNGEITLEITSTLKQQITEALAEDDADILVFDLSEVTFMDSSGIGFLVARNTAYKGSGKKMYLFKPSTQVRKTLDLVQLSSFFDILDTEDDLVAVLPA